MSSRYQVYYAEHRDIIKIKKREHYHKNREKRLRQMQIWRKNNLDHRRQYKNSYQAIYRKTDEYKFEHALRMRIWTSIRNQSKGQARKCAKTTSLVGCSITDLKIYLESRFEPGMSWQNFGSVWHMDHIMPCSIFDLSKPWHQKRCFHFSNLRPCFVSENLRKGSKVINSQFNLL